MQSHESKFRNPQATSDGIINTCTPRAFDRTLSQTVALYQNTPTVCESFHHCNLMVSSSSSTSAAFIGGALSFKGDKKKKKTKKKNKVKHDVASSSLHSSKSSVPLHSAGIPKDDDDNNNHNIEEEEDDEMTDAERAAYKKKQERELKELEFVAKQSHRERVEAYNEKLSQLTEHNDIPRVSAAGNG
jgi:protein FAM32A